jgi:hypothetical protein
MLAQHIVANRVWWFQVWMGEGSPDLAPIGHWDPADEEEQSAIDGAAYERQGHEHCPVEDCILPPAIP